ncbi:mitogen-activated protein kinase kinase kinase 9 [Platysternon megacephalum]|uniref:Mitogen-activated protein kinase kinase kinase 9 n=1 Tax=Platysternon megacephalum TaxID=55544 RepID=A0A4D9EUA8_9SAUR|nr:mitogen-activated protein kinase kinase kinase 9 [Platysternon megacephalum]
MFLFLYILLFSLHCNAKVVFCKWVFNVQYEYVCICHEISVKQVKKKKKKLEVLQEWEKSDAMIKLHRLELDSSHGLALSCAFEDFWGGWHLNIFFFFKQYQLHFKNTQIKFYFGYH